MRKISATQANTATGDFHAVSLNLGHLSVDETKRYVAEVGEGKRKVADAVYEVALSILKSHADPQRPTTGAVDTARLLARKKNRKTPKITTIS